MGISTSLKTSALAPRALWRGLVIVACLALAQQSAAVSFPDKPPNSSFYVDSASIIELEQGQGINEIASALLAQERVPIFAVTIRSLAAHGAETLSIEQYARKLFDKWGIGSQERNNGVLLLVSVLDRKARIELGENWAHKQDTAARRIMDELIIPSFKAENYSVGVFDGVRGLDAMVRGADLPKPTTPWWFLPAIVAAAIGIVALVYNLFKSGRSGWAWAVIVAVAMLLFFVLRTAGRASGSGGGFGGGSGGGGGATGSW